MNRITIRIMMIMILAGMVQGQIRITTYIGRFGLDHYETTDHCGFTPEFFVDFNDMDSLVLIEHDVSEEIADCECEFDLHLTFANPGIGPHTIYVYRSYSAPGMEDSLRFMGTAEFNSFTEHSAGGLPEGWRNECNNLPTDYMVYPFAVGNEWHYQSEYIPDEYNLGISQTIFRVVGDTTMPNDKQYWRVSRDILTNSNPAYTLFWRQDELSGLVYEYLEDACSNDERILYDLNFSDLGPYRWFTCDYDGFSRSNSGGYASDNTVFLETDLDGLYSQTTSFQEDRGKTLTITSELSTHVETLEGWIIDGVQGGTLLSADDTHTSPSEYWLSAPYPNPFNPSVRLDYTLAHQAQTTFSIVDIQAKLIWSHTRDDFAGLNSISWNGITNKGAKAVSGIYFFRVSSGEWSKCNKILLAK